MIQNTKIIFNIPSLDMEYIFSAKLYLDVNNIRHIVEQSIPINYKPICTFSILHSFIGDLHKLNITCQEFTSNDYNCKNTLEPIFTQYCIDNLIDLEFYCNEL